MVKLRRSFGCAVFVFLWKMKTMLVFSLLSLYTGINLNWSDLYAL